MFQQYHNQLLYPVKVILLFITSFIILLNLLKLRSKNIKKDEWGFLLSSFFLTLFLALIIEIKPHHILRTKFSISNLITYLFYFILVSIFFLKYIKLIIRFKYSLVIISYTFFGLANVVDLLSDGKLIVFGLNEIFEDIFHILGIVFWLLFFLDYSKRIKIKYL